MRQIEAPYCELASTKEYEEYVEVFGIGKLL